jgi:hypothetical protein
MVYQGGRNITERARLVAVVYLGKDQSVREIGQRFAKHCEMALPKLCPIGQRSK